MCLAVAVGALLRQELCHNCATESIGTRESAGASLLARTGQLAARDSADPHGTATRRLIGLPNIEALDLPCRSQLKVKVRAKIAPLIGVKTPR